MSELIERNISALKLRVDAPMGLNILYGRRTVPKKLGLKSDKHRNKR